jgi:PASTA domain
MRSPWVWIGLLGVALVGGAYLIYRRNQASTAAAATTTPTTDQTDLQGEIATLQSEIADLQSSAAQGTGTGTGTTTTGTGTTTTGGGTGTTPAVQVTVPHVEGMGIDSAEAAIRAVGLVPRLNMTGIKGGTSYVISSQTPGAGKKVAKGSNVDLAAAKKPAAAKAGAPHLVKK